MDVQLNQSLVERQGLSETDINVIKKLHHALHEIMDAIELTDVNNVTLMRQYSDLIEQLEYTMQAAWQFPLNRNMHSWWYRIPKCECPKLDNCDLAGFDERIITQSCPIHGKT